MTKQDGCWQMLLPAQICFMQGWKPGTRRTGDVERSEDIAALHNSFIDAGAKLIPTNSFRGTDHRRRLHGAEARLAELNKAAARIACKPVDIGRDRHGHDIVVAGSIGPTGQLFPPMGALDHGEALAAFTAQAEALAAGGADLL